MAKGKVNVKTYTVPYFSFSIIQSLARFLPVKMLFDEIYFTLKIISIKKFHFTVVNCIIENNVEIIF